LLKPGYFRGPLVAGIPGRLRRELGEDEIQRVRDNAVRYTALVRRTER
jgi:hypothetical protein